MFFTKSALVIAWLLVILGGLQVVVAYNIDPDLAPRYFAGKTPGQAIDRGALYCLIGIAAGMVAEISKSVASRGEAKSRREAD
ncbi:MULTISPECIES: hypothetical protein [unclassified Mesorhizobium]|uniref:hypothetical protein n=1 Tax=unclassified Mesorhizobium TaxID=325217 RepID=UPI000FD78D23|nr:MULTISPECIES: hypothetical protein [unclassified Mesorhizobium]TGQ19362.1 hypothetical protein EN860_019745 [Mesorhizobium sp. M00.F.Ca.ET.217.01.1.1]TGV89065.1 hypothetical protein EN801_021280 [Mesorhizobium sp. M00.F.Ca.ET.158.01.1.1]